MRLIIDKPYGINFKMLIMKLKTMKNYELLTNNSVLCNIKSSAKNVATIIHFISACNE